MKHTASVVIGGQTYLITQYSPSKALRILTLLGKVIGGPMSQLATSGGKGGLLDMKLDQSGSEVLGKAVEALFENLDENKIDFYVKDILSEVTVGGGGARVVDQFDTHFQGRLEDLFALVRKVLEVNFGNFFKGLIAKGKAAESVPA